MIRLLFLPSDTVRYKSYSVVSWSAIHLTEQHNVYNVFVYKFGNIFHVLKCKSCTNRTLHSKTFDMYDKYFYMYIKNYYD